ncbi:MAG TPA: DUF3592 domain-containing protein [Thermoanaerobaculia bacterium]|nr:DUF3592 domain-containing protein [Thermoanaerobaculia bacterium]
MPLLIAIAVAIIVLAVRAHRIRAARDRAWMAKAKLVDGVLTKCDLMPGDESDYYWCAVEYKVRGIAYQLTGSFDFTPKDIGTKVAVAYDPKLPSDARLV